MLLNEETLQKFGYTVDSLSPKSSKAILTKCDYCGEQIETTKKRYVNGRKDIPKDCCWGCRPKKRAEVSLLKYGVENPFQRESVKQKIKETCLEKYGTEYALQSEEVRGKIKETMVERYGVEAPMDSLELRERLKKACVEKYGVENVSSLDEVKKKRKETNLEKYGHEYYVASEDCRKRVKEKYGVDNVFQLEEVKEKIRQHNLSVYGVDHRNKLEENKKYGQDNHFSTKETQDKIKATNLEKYGYENATKNAEVKEKARRTRIEKGNEYEFDGVGIREIAEKMGVCYTTAYKNIIKYGYEQAIQMEKTETNLEYLVRSFLDSQGIQYESQFRVDKKVADFRIGNVLIECDGLYWHSEEVISTNRGVNGKTYHFDKRQLYVDRGFSPLFFRSDEIENKFDIVSSIIINAVGMNQRRLYARNLDFAEISNSEAYDFCEKYHLMGGFKSASNSFALKDNGNIVAILQTKNIVDNNYDISRFCCLPNTSIIGGFTKLLSNFEKTVNPSSTQTFVDLRYGSGDYLKNFGFSLESCSPSFKWTNGTQTFHRMKFPSNTGYDNGLTKIWDCGQAKFVKSP